MFSNARKFSAQPIVKKLFVIQYKFVEGILEKRAPYRSEHLKILQRRSESGDCLLGGAFMEPADGSILLFNSRKCAEDFVKEDPYNKAGLVTHWEIRDFAAVVGSLHTKL
mmetsp:Transcript_1063/g.1606  ORF Transcript_1063/g.1606 Transcript_1063/m.1606 type:complete len:110 (+) Transcript_1063:37-366(+)